MDRVSEFVLITGGARSGKSDLALKLASAQGRRLAFVATAEVKDEEMAERVAIHRAKRGPGWHTFEEPLHLGTLLSEIYERYDSIVVDCLTLWLSNLLLSLQDPEEVRREIQETFQRLRSLRGARIYFVTNEVGMGIVPEHPLARMFRDLAGWMNQQFASLCREVYLVVAGQPLRIK